VHEADATLLEIDFPMIRTNYLTSVSGGAVKLIWLASLAFTVAMSCSGRTEVARVVAHRQVSDVRGLWLSDEFDTQLGRARQQLCIENHRYSLRLISAGADLKDIGDLPIESAQLLRVGESGLKYVEPFRFRWDANVLVVTEEKAVHRYTRVAQKRSVGQVSQ
jgi:hypothetical protein